MKNKPLTIAVASFKGGTGKTTSAVHIAGVLSRLGQTYLVDSDPNRAAIGWHERGSGLPFQVASLRQLQRGLDRSQFPFLVIDSEPGISRADFAEVAENCDYLIVPSTPDALGISVLLQVADELQSLKVSHWRVLLTICPPKPSHAGEDAIELLRARGLPVLSSFVRRRVAFQKAALDGSLVSEIENGSEGWQEYQTATNEVLGAFRAKGKCA